MPDSFQCNNYAIKKVRGGYILTMEQPLTGQAQLLIRDDGAMLNVRGEPIYLQDILTVRAALSRVDGGIRILKLLHKAPLNPQLITLLRKYRQKLGLD